MPCGRITRPTTSRGSAGDLDEDVDVGSGGCGTGHLPDGARHPASLSDDATEVVGIDMEAEGRTLGSWGDFDRHCVRVGHDRSCEIFEGSGYECFVAVLGCFFSHMPTALSSAWADSEGWAPLASHARILSSSKRMVDGSVKGL